MAGSEKFFWEYSKLPREMQENVMKQMDNEALRRMREVSKGSRALANFELERRRRVALRVCRKVYADRVGEMPSKWMPLERIVAANEMRVVEAATSDDFAKQDPPFEPDKILRILLNIPLTDGHAVAANAFDWKLMNDTYRDVRINHVQFPLGLKTIGDSAFYAVDNLNCSIYFPETLEKIDKDAFNCPSISGTLRFPKSLTSIGDRAFFNCEYIDRVEFAENANVVVGEKAFCINVNGTVHIPATARLTFAGDELTFDRARHVECTAQFFANHRLQFRSTGLRCTLLPAAAAAAGTGAVFGRPHDYAMQQIN